MKLISLEDYAKQYAEERVEALVRKGNWDTDRYPDISYMNERLVNLKDELLDMADNESKVDIYAATALLYAKALAREAYLLGILDGSHIQQKFSLHEVPTE